MTFILNNFILFTVYSLLGWLSETIYCFAIDRKYVNRGFLNGPFCPIYGFGAILVINLLSKYNDDMVALFFVSMALTGFVEYITSYALEKSFNLSLWDYSGYKFNLNGRVCLWNLTLFGIMSIAMVKIIHPFVLGILLNIPIWVYYISIAILIPYFISDLIITVRALNQIKSMVYSHMLDLETITKVRDELRDDIRATLEQKRQVKIKYLHRRLLEAFPNMKLLEKPNAFNDFREELKKRVK